MNPKEVFDNTAYSVQLPYIAGHSLSALREGGMATRTRLTSDPNMTSQNGFAACAYTFTVRPSAVGLPSKCHIL